MQHMVDAEQIDPPSGGTVSAMVQNEIYLYSLSVYERPGLTAQGLGCLIKPLSHELGRPHSISVHILANLLGCSIENLKQWTEASECFVKMVWIFPGWDHPRFTTRHLVVTDTAPGNVSFSGGLDWAVKMWKAAQRFQPPSCPFLGRQIPPGWNPGPPHGGPKLPLQPVPFMDLAKWKLERPALADPTGHGLRGRADDEVSEFSEPASDSSAIFSEPSETADPEFGEDSWSNELEDSSRAERQLQLDALRRKRREAEALYARNGDTSGLLAVLATASQSPDNWDASGMPRF
ncbi:hypothetical protein B0I37DRAFT_212197 [Chaetomium sp. MPI-CAGE-AT-0009]|nr:hypothetical protein B0I37DRAFT_212197 [Chaetomium sp. MPI-CAGE-AT-0009]